MIHYSVNFCEQNCTFKIYQTKLLVAAEHTEDARHCVPGGDGGNSLSNPRHHLEAADVLLKKQPHCTSLLTLAFSTLLLTELLWREYFAKNMHNILVPDLNDSLLVLAG